MSNRIKALREARGLSLESLAGLVGTTNQQISNLESGKRRLTVDWLQRLGEALACHPWTLVAGDVVEGGKLHGGLAPQEQLLLQAFRQLNIDQRLAVLTLISPPAGTPSAQQATALQQKG